jgi:hypothetical protein
MSIIGSNILAGASGQAGGGGAAGYQIERSLRFNSSDSAYLGATFGTPTDQDVFTLSMWVKRSALGSTQHLFGVSTNHSFGFTSGDALNLTFGGSSALTTTALFRDPSAWYHIMWVQNGTAHTLYVNGTSAGTATATSNTFNTAVAHQISAGNTANFFNGYDNSTAAALGTDTSGNSNTWTVNNISVTAGADNDSLVDSPTNYGTGNSGGDVRGNYATLNPLIYGGSISAPTNGNLDVSSSTAYGTIYATIGVNSGKWYWEFTNTSTGSNGSCVGISAAGATLSSDAGAYSKGYIYCSGALKANNNSYASYGASWNTNGDIIGIAFDADNGTLTFYKNGSTQGQAYSGIASTSEFYFPVFADANGANSGGGSFNFGQRQWVYAAPAGFKALCTQNLPTGSITTSGSFTGNANADGPFVYLNGVPTAMTINSNAVTFATHADKLSNGFKLRTSSGSYNTAGSNTYSITTTGAEFKFARAQPNP